MSDESRRQGVTPALCLERWAVQVHRGERTLESVPEQDREAVRALLEVDGEHRSRGVEADVSAIFEDAGAPRARASTWRQVALAASVMVALGAGIMAVQDSGSVEERARQDVTRAKGELAELILWRAVNGETERLSDGARVAPGSVIQPQYRVARGRALFGVIFSLDSAGDVSLHFPSAIDGQTALAVGDATTVERAFVLDDTPGVERFVFVASDAPIDVDALLATVREHPRDFEVQDVVRRRGISVVGQLTLEKEVGP